jgi:ribosomal protein S12 methylthiotransferase
MNETLMKVKKKVAIVSNNFHCERHVQYFSTIEKYFKSNGWEIAENFNVDKVVICACGFHNAMFEKVMTIFKDLENIHFLEKNILIMGCIPKTHPEDLNKVFNGHIIPYRGEVLLDEIIRPVIPFNEIRWVNVFRSHPACDLAEKEELFHIKISEGCLRKCTFCVINKAKGYIKSFPTDEIIEQFKRARDQGFRKVFLMGEDTFAYGIDGGTTIIDLVETLVEIDPTVELNFGYLHIRWLKEYAKQIISLCKRGVIRELHIGLQHINNELLEKMGRPVDFSRLYDIIGTIKNQCPDFYMACDIIVGFPGETREMFNQLVDFFKQDTYFNKVRHAGYSDVKGAPAAKLKNKVPPAEIAYRWEFLDKLLGERSSYGKVDQINRGDDLTYKLTQMHDYAFCKDTFKEEDYRKGIAREPIAANSTVLKEDKEDFAF